MEAEITCFYVKYVYQLEKLKGAVALLVLLGPSGSFWHPLDPSRPKTNCNTFNTFNTLNSFNNFSTFNSSNIFNTESLYLDFFRIIWNFCLFRSFCRSMDASCSIFLSVILVSVFLIILIVSARIIIKYYYN